MFGKFQADIGSGILNIPGVRSFILGQGVGNGIKASEFNDGFIIRDGEIRHLTNHASGVLGGITTGEDLVFTMDIKPTPSTEVPQRSVDLRKYENTTIVSQGRFDTNFVPRILMIAEAVAAIITVNHLMLASRLPHDSLIPFEERLGYGARDRREG